MTPSPTYLTCLPMRIIRHSDPDYSRQLDALSADSSLFDSVIEDRTWAILQSVRERGDAALVELTERFDGANLAADQLAVTSAELLNASLQADDSLRAAVAEAHRNIAAFAKRSLRKPWEMRNSHGGVVGEKFDPFQRVGIYIPGGTAPLVSTALMTVTLAKVAGCSEIVVCTPPGRDGSINPALLFAARTAGATEVHRVGGAQAIAALGYGTASIRRVRSGVKKERTTPTANTTATNSSSTFGTVPSPRIHQAPAFGWARAWQGRGKGRWRRWWRKRNGEGRMGRW